MTDHTTDQSNASNIKSREHAEQLKAYFEDINRQYPGEVWQHGFETARRWVELINAQSISQAEITAFMGVIHANKHRSTGWYDLALGAYHWARVNDFQVAPPELFWLPSPTMRLLESKTTSHHCAETLIMYFEQQTHEDPNQDIWELALLCTREWLRLIDSSESSSSDSSELIRLVEKNMNRGEDWIVLAVGVYHWSTALGFSELWSSKSLPTLEGFSHAQTLGLR